MAKDKWIRINWRRGAKGRPTRLFAAQRVRVAEGHEHRMLDDRMQCMPGEEVWLVGERRSTGEQKYYVSNLPANTNLWTLAATIKARWVCEQAHQQLKEELGLEPLRRQILDRITQPRLDGHDRLRLPTVSPPQGRGAEKKMAAHRRNRVRRPTGKPSSTFSYALLLGNARIARDFSSRWPHLIRQNSDRVAESSAFATGGRLGAVHGVREFYTQLLGRAGERQLGGVRLGLTHNLDGAPFSSIVAVSIFGRLH